MGFFIFPILLLMLFVYNLAVDYLKKTYNYKNVLLVITKNVTFKYLERSVMNYTKTDCLRRYALASCVLFILMNLYPLIMFIKGYNLHFFNYIYSLLSLGFLFFSLIFMRLHYYQNHLIAELQKHKVKTNSIAAKRLSQIISEEEKANQAEKIVSSPAPVN